ncbi:C-type lectin domain family 4 member E isoform X1 [Xyrauchen texanus]|uniref:C-type lectin domain family 4 member E isoform X1 n=1 Tax=Xyrauchen texanus TaxID=154827 RepID=UPI002241D3C8|nr:C-type lectin domain family 4 member E isoform X1 [Xyrauchen texanus]
MVLSVLLFLSLLANGVLIYLYFTANTMFWQCEPVTNCSNSGHEQGIPSCSYEDIKSLTYCPGLQEQWFKGKGSFYVFSSLSKNWSSSKQYCQDLGGDLVIVNNTEEKEFLAQRQCLSGESSLYWSDKREGNCAVLKGHTQEDISCLREEKSICEIPCLQ